ncbi:TIGR03943 family putative permease subunit [uncultured Desulfosarcina sp.]|uniref:TIGR03943 family putative permease subunit n=1 Tax=uncultured Desulfosarcina sp. TaxID=218289 RepID=UPI0029C68C8F|nr:TIGR03943 family protein [uncultured Desulfosarcina sp.]
MIRIVKKGTLSVCRYLDVLLFLAWLAALCGLLLTGKDTAFLHPRFRLFLAGGTVLLTAFILVILFGPKRHNTGWPLAMTTGQALVIMAPLLFLATAVNQGMGSHTLTRKFTGTEQNTLTRLLESGNGTIGEANPTPAMSLLDIARKMKQIDGRRVITEGLVYRPDIMPENYLTLFRFAIFCCAADAMPVWVFVENAGVAAFADENWIRVDGTVRIVNFNGTDVPVIRADTIVKKPAPPPGEQYLFF